MAEAISLGNVLTIIIFIVGLATHLIVITAILTKWKTATSMRMENFEKLVATIMASCASCYLKKATDDLEIKVAVVKTEQDRRIVELPLQLEAIRTEMNRMNELFAGHLTRYHSRKDEE
uniref:Uncharacterized protein n=1 Tax=viral metagenome TaxID=1070528 RepID=A0A6M3J757_9ZZZZ